MRKHVPVAPFDMADYLDSEEVILEFLASAAQDETPTVLIRAIGAVAKARGIVQLAQASGLSRKSLYKALVPDARPSFDTVRRILSAIGFGIAIVPLQTRSRDNRTRPLLAGTNDSSAGNRAVFAKRQSDAKRTKPRARASSGAKRVTGSRSVRYTSSRLQSASARRKHQKR